MQSESEGPQGTGLSLLEAVYQFELAFSNGTKPDLTRYLERVKPSDKQTTFVELVRSEFNLRLRAGEAVTVAEYVVRFPELSESTKLLITLQDMQRKHTLQASVPRVPGHVLVERLGQGGMGEVWRALQTDPIKRSVAIKVIKPGLDSEAVLARFNLERQVLAVLEHTNIARIYHAGLTDQGRPFFVMELVTGKPITEYCDEKKLTIKDRLRLFVQVCRAVQYAHQKGVIHRDLKPGNILVCMENNEPKSKIIDFGLAKVITGKNTEEWKWSKGEHMVGTLEYMAPEQAQYSASAVLDTRADVYSLGVILYELLTGLTPFDMTVLQNAAYHEVIRHLVEDDPPSLSMRLAANASLPVAAAVRQLEPGNLLSFVKGELDWIARKCLDKDPAARYESANGLALEIESYLAGEPVTAMPVSTTYFVKKFCQRHRVLVLACCAVFASLLAGMLATAWQAHKAYHAEALASLERDRKEKERRRAFSTLRLMTDDVVERLIGAKDTIGENERDFLSLVLQRWTEFAGYEGEGDQAQAIRAEGLRRVADLNASLGNSTAAEQEYRAAIAEGEQLLSGSFTTPEIPHELAQSYNNLGLSLFRLERYQEADVCYRKALTLKQQLVHRMEASMFLASLARTYRNLGNLCVAEGKFEDATNHYRNELNSWKSLSQDNLKSPFHLSQLAMSHDNLGHMYSRLGEHTKANQDFEQACSLRKSLLSKNPADRHVRHSLGVTYYNLGNVAVQLKNADDAIAYYRQSMQLLEKLVGQFPSIRQYQLTMIRSQSALGLILKKQGQLAEAKALYEKAIKAIQRLSDRESPDAQYELSTLHFNLAILGDDQGMEDFSSSHYLQSKAICERLVQQFPKRADYRYDLSKCLNNLGNLLSDRGDVENAEIHYNQVLAIREALVTLEPANCTYRHDLAKAHDNLGRLLNKGARCQESETHSVKAIAILTALLSESPSSPVYRKALGSAQNNYGLMLQAQKRWQDSEAAFLQALQLRENLVTENPDAPQYKLDLGGVQCNLGNLKVARSLYSESLAWHDDAISNLRTIQDTRECSRRAKQFLYNAYRVRAHACYQLTRFRDAAMDLGEALKLCKEKEKEKVLPTLALCLARSGNIKEALVRMQELRQLSDAASWNGIQLHDAACVHALASLAIPNEKDKHLDIALGYLRISKRQGSMNIKKISNDSCLGAVRQLKGFSELLK